MAFGDNQWRAHAELIGQVTLSWNQVVHQFLRVLSHFTGLPDELCDAILFSYPLDKSQRALAARVEAQACLKVSLPPAPECPLLAHSRLRSPPLSHDDVQA